MFQKIPPKFHDKTVQFNILRLNLNKINVFYNQHRNKVSPHFTFMRRAQNADTHALKQHRLSQNISPVCSSFVLVIASDIHLEPESEKRAKNVDFHTAKNIHIQPTLFRYFLTNSYKLTSGLFTVVRPQGHNKNTTPPPTLKTNTHTV